MFITISNINSTERYDVSLISQDLLSNAIAVVRTDQMVYEYINPSTSTIKIKYAITILSPQGDYNRNISIYYNSSYEKIKNLIIRYYDEKGKLIKNIYEKDIDDIGVAGIDEYNDFRMKSYTIPRMRFPYTIEYEYINNSTFSIKTPSFAFQNNYNISVEQSSFQAIFPKNVPFRYYEKNINNKVDSDFIDKKKVYTWIEENIPAYEKKSYDLPFQMKAPMVYITPIHFVFNDFAGDFSSWESFGKWEYQLIQGRDSLLPDQIEKVKKLVEGITNEKEKISILYKYFQQYTRYISVGNGIEGWQPNFAYEVAQTGFGDCKDLTNYMKAILKAAGIKSYYTNIYGGKDPGIVKEFPSQQFNHIILCIPLSNSKDTMWLECTSQTSPPGFLGYFTDDRYALLITKEGGKLVRTPRYTFNEDVVKINASVDITINGNASAEMNLDFYGPQYDVVANFKDLTPTEKIYFLRDILSVPGFDLTTSNYTENTALTTPVGKLDAKMDIFNVATNNSHQIIFCPGLGEKEQYFLEDMNDVFIRNDFARYDTIVYSYPGGYKPIYMPKPQEIETPYGAFKYKIDYKDNKIYYYRTFVLFKGNYKGNELLNITKFINLIARQDNLFIVLSNN
jgi:transglutaminase-like putative cysteine protease